MTPTRDELARELAERNERCGHQQPDSICLRPLKHEGDHAYEPISSVIPIT